MLSEKTSVCRESYKEAAPEGSSRKSLVKHQIQTLKTISGNLSWKSELSPRLDCFLLNLCATTFHWLYLLLYNVPPVDRPQIPANKTAGEVQLGENGHLRNACTQKAQPQLQSDRNWTKCTSVQEVSLWKDDVQCSTQNHKERGRNGVELSLRSLASSVMARILPTVSSLSGYCTSMGKTQTTTCILSLSVGNLL